LQYKKVEDSLWVIVLKRGEKIIEKLLEFINKENIKSGYFNAIGAISSVELGHYNLEKKKYTTRVMDSPLEIVSLLGNVAVKEKELIIHAHIVVGTEKMELYGGHLKEATVAVTCEVMFNELKQIVKREYDSETGLNLIQPGGIGR